MTSSPTRNSRVRGSTLTRLIVSRLIVRHLAIWIIVLFATLLTLGCIAQFQEAIRKHGGAVQSSEDTVTLETGGAGRPAAQTETPGPASGPTKDADVKTVPVEKDVPQKAEASPPKGLVKPKPAKDLEPPTEEEVVKEAAVKMGQSLEPVLSIKICYLSPKDEWWASIYHDLGHLIDVKQFIWNREQEKLEPFTVLTQIPRNKLKVHLTNNKPGSRCEILSPPWIGSGTQGKSDGSSAEFSHR